MNFDPALASLSVYYLQKVIPKGAAEHDELYSLISRLQQVAQSRRPSATGSSHSGYVQVST